MPRMVSKFIAAVWVVSAVGFAPATASAVPVSVSVPESTGAVVDAQPVALTGSGVIDLTLVLLQCLRTGSSVIPGDPMGFPVVCV